MEYSQGTWKIGKTGGTVVTDDPTGFPINSGHAESDYYGGYLIAESILKKDDAKLIAAAPALLRECENSLSYLNSFQKEWKEGEEMLAAMLQLVIKKATD